MIAWRKFHTNDLINPFYNLKPFKTLFEEFNLALNFELLQRTLEKVWKELYINLSRCNIPFVTCGKKCNFSNDSSKNMSYWPNLILILLIA